jgi:hypothetical protein
MFGTGSGQLPFDLRMVAAPLLHGICCVIAEQSILVSFVARFIPGLLVIWRYVMTIVILA